MPPRIDPNGPTLRLQLVAPPSWIAKIDDWRSRQGIFAPNRSEAIRYLVEQALAAELKPSSRRRGSPKDPSNDR